MSDGSTARASGLALGSAALLRLLWLSIGTLLSVFSVQAYGVTTANVSESRVPPYVLPDVLSAADGARISTPEEWISKRRPELLRLFETEVYGRAPKEKADLKFEVTAVESGALNGKATRKEVTILVSTPRGKLPLHLLLYVPNARQPVPAFVGLNFLGNQSVDVNPTIAMSRSYVQGKPESGIIQHKATEKSRGAEASRWQVEEVIGRGYALATMCCGDIDPDFDDGFQNGLHPLFFKSGQTAPAPDEWGTIAAWAWGLSRILDYLETESAIDAKHVAVIGHSRLGKTALWAGATDPRFAMVISNDSGCGGAALSKRIFGETVGMINKNFPHWFCRNFHKYSDHEDRLPVDQHMLIALIAPRPVYVASASEDMHADPYGEFLAIRHASPVYRLFGLGGVDSDNMPPVDHPMGGTMHYHVRSGSHDIMAYDWEQYLAFADAQWRSSR